MHLSDPLSNILQMGLQEGMTVADLGCGSGHYAISAAHIVGKEGHVYAVDIQEDVLTRLAREAKERDLPQLATLRVDIDTGIPLKRASLDAIILSNTLFQLESKAALFGEMRHLLKKGGKLLLIDWSGGVLGPKGAHMVAKEKVEELAAGAGFTKMKTLTTDPHHYAFLFVRA